jgi:hypothetical protein
MIGGAAVLVRATAAPRNQVWWRATMTPARASTGPDVPTLEAKEALGAAGPAVSWISRCALERPAG